MEPTQKPAVKVDVPQPKVEAPKQEVDALDESYGIMVLRDFTIPHGSVTEECERGQIIDDPVLIKKIINSFPQGRSPIRRATKKDILDARPY